MVGTFGMRNEWRGGLRLLLVFAFLLSTSHFSSAQPPVTSARPLGVDANGNVTPTAVNGIPINLPGNAKIDLVPITGHVEVNEVWISATATRSSATGTISDPYDGSTQALFDALMVAIPVSTKINLGPGIFTTNGNISFKEGWRVWGRGKALTTIKLANGQAQTAASVKRIFTWADFSGAPRTYVELGEMTLDLNGANQGIYTGLLAGYLDAFVISAENAKVQNIKALSTYASPGEGFPCRIYRSTVATAGRAEVSGVEAVSPVGVMTAISVFDQGATVGAFTADAGTDILTRNAHGMSDGSRVQVTNSGGGLPGGLAVSTLYFARDTTTNTFKLAASLGGAAIDITTAGTGTHSLNRYDGYWSGFIRDCTVTNSALATGFGAGGWKDFDVINNKTDSIRDGMVIDTHQYNNVRIADNKFRSCSRYGILLNGSKKDNVQILDNTIETTAAATSGPLVGTSGTGSIKVQRNTLISGNVAVRAFHQFDSYTGIVADNTVTESTATTMLAATGLEVTRNHTPAGVYLPMSRTTTQKLADVGLTVGTDIPGIATANSFDGQNTFNALVIFDGEVQFPGGEDTIPTVNEDGTLDFLPLGALQTVRRNGADDAFEAFSIETTTMTLTAKSMDGDVNTFTDLPFTAFKDYATSTLSLTDPNADRMLFWDDSAGVFTWLTPGTNLSITGTTLNAAGGSVATDSIFDAKGDLVVGTGANTAAKLTAGTDGYLLMAESSETTGLVWTLLGTVAYTGDASDLTGTLANARLDPDLQTWAGVTPGTGVATALAVANNAAGGYSPIDGTATLSNKTLTAPKFASGGFIADANGNEALRFVTTASAVNDWQITNAIATGRPVLTATGDDTNVDSTISNKGSGQIYITNTGNSGGMRLQGGMWLQGGSGVTTRTIDLAAYDGSLISLASGIGIVWESSATISAAKDTGLRRNAAGVLEVNSGTSGTFRDIKARTTISSGTAFASLPTAQAGMQAYVTDGAAGSCGDGTCTTWGTAVTGGGGALKLLIWYNGTAWTLVGK